MARFARIPARAASSTLTARSLRVLIAIGIHADERGEAYPSLGTLSRITGIGRQDLPRLLTELIGAGFIQRTSGKAAAGRASNTYRVIMDPTVSAGADSAATDSVATVSASALVTVSADADLTDRLTDQGKRAAGRRRDDVIDADFDAVWPSYPRHVGKDAARRAYRSVRDKGVSAEAISAGVIRYADERRAEEPRYTAHFKTWLNAGRYADEPETAVVIGDEKHGPRRRRSAADSLVAAFDTATQ